MPTNARRVKGGPDHPKPTVHRYVAGRPLQVPSYMSQAPGRSFKGVQQGVDIDCYVHDIVSTVGIRSKSCITCGSTRVSIMTILHHPQPNLSTAPHAARV
ncbi:hypothetical protein AcW1_009351 [Taiwanofungus camphoratus]|nr:hypothetical protein AcW1_009351 [Antrodia cinnamomea]